jgi:hypothetical protein
MLQIHGPYNPNQAQIKNGWRMKTEYGLRFAFASQISASEPSQKEQPAPVPGHLPEEKP